MNAGGPKKNRRDHASNIIGVSTHINQLHEDIKTAAKSDETVLILGPTGTGKELIAEEIHKLSKRREKSYKIINSGGLPEHTIESELFGHVKGAFTGAIDDRIGAFEEASSGTIFLDEIGDIPPRIQVKLLRVLDGKPFTKLGGNEPIENDTRLIAATNKKIEKLIYEDPSSFREDLYHRLAQYKIRTEPLNNRPEDVVVLVNDYEKANKKRINSLVKALIYSYDFPGNVRELNSWLNKEYDYLLQEYEKKLDKALIDTINENKNSEELNFSMLIELYEILTLKNQAKLRQNKIAENLYIRSQIVKSSPSFKKRYGFNFNNNQHILNKLLPWKFSTKFIGIVGRLILASS